MKKIASVEDIAVLENFRASHAYVINTFQMNSRRHSAKYNRTFGQRLKRRSTIVDKLEREPSMPLYAMQDIAGCRMIFDNQDDLYNARQSLRDARFKHKRLNEPDRFDYIKSPKQTGYRGVHDVYEFFIPKPPSSKWNGLKVEIQFRTRVQHAWATAVEVADLISSSRIKFNDAQSSYLRYFQLASEILARTSENQFSCCSDLTDAQVCDEFYTIDKRLGLMRTFESLRESEKKKASFRRNTLLIFKFGQEDPDERLEIRQFDTVGKAIEEYDALEKQFGDTADIVLVRGESEENIRDAFRNYFSDARAFVDLIQSGLERLGPNHGRFSALELV